MKPIYVEAPRHTHLEGPRGGDGLASCPARRNVGELGPVVRDEAGEADSGGGDQVPNDAQHADAAVLELDISEAVELELVAVSHHAERVEEAEGRLGAELVLEGHGQSRRLGRLLGRGEGGGRRDEGGKDGELHDETYGCGERGRSQRC